MGTPALLAALFTLATISTQFAAPDEGSDLREHTYQLGKNQLQALVEESFATTVDDPFGGGGKGQPKTINIPPDEAAASARDTLVGKWGMAISAADPVEISFPKRYQLKIKAPQKLHAQIARALDHILDPPQVQLSIHAFKIPEGKSVEDLIGDAAKGNLIDEKDLPALKKKLVEGGAELTSTPSVISTANQRARIEMIREFIYPTEYDPPEIEKDQAGNFGTIVTPANPTAFDVRNIGFSWEISPTLRADGKIGIEGAIENVQFQGFINYGSAIKGIDGKGKAVTLTENRILQPLFVVESLSTNLALKPDQVAILYGAAPRKQAQLDQAVVEKEDLPEDKRIPKPAKKQHHLYLVQAKQVAG